MALGIFLTAEVVLLAISQATSDGDDCMEMSDSDTTHTPFDDVISNGPSLTESLPDLFRFVKKDSPGDIWKLLMNLSHRIGVLIEHDDHRYGC